MFYESRFSISSRGQGFVRRGFFDTAVANASFVSTVKIVLRLKFRFNNRILALDILGYCEHSHGKSQWHNCPKRFALIDLLEVCNIFFNGLVLDLYHLLVIC